MKSTPNVGQGIARASAGQPLGQKRSVVPQVIPEAKVAGSLGQLQHRNLTLK